MVNLSKSRTLKQHILFMEFVIHILNLLFGSNELESSICLILTNKKCAYTIRNVFIYFREVIQ